MDSFPIDALMYTISIWALPVLLAVTLHEAAHGWVAMKLGDPTAKLLGRVTFNPLKHIDKWGTIVIPAGMLILSGGKMLFGFAKPVPVNFSKLRQPKRDMVLVALAGPGINLIMAIVAAAGLHVLPYLDGDVQAWIGYNLGNALFINVLLAIFNMLPLPPLDGGRVAVGLLPWSIGQYLARLERVGIFIVLFAIFLLPYIGGKIGVELNVFGWLILAPANALQDVILTLVGFGA
ncbi:site-2 protease family protein [Rhodospirillales bacterium]|nr:site-2 protease family protein [Rhodospirillales bacterium]